MLESDFNLEEQFQEAEVRDGVRATIARLALNERQKFIVDNRLLAEEPMTLQEVGSHLGLSRERVRQIEVQLSQKIKAEFV
jgi:RNA polymerase sigma-32 factor